MAKSKKQQPAADQPDADPQIDPAPASPAQPAKLDRCLKCRRRLHGRFDKCPSCGAEAVA